MKFEQPLSEEAMSKTLNAIMDGETCADEIRLFLSTLARRGESSGEIASAVRVLRSRALKLPLSKDYELCDTCGTGGDGKGTYNISTIAALVAAASGVRVSKHGNRAASSLCGSADLIEALGVNLDAKAFQVARCIEEFGFGFCFARTFHPAMKAVAAVRKELGIRTLFNLVGPLANPARLTFQLVGVSDKVLMRPMADALVRLGIRHGMVVHGHDGLDEVTTADTTEILEVRGTAIERQLLEPKAVGLAGTSPKDLLGGDAACNARATIKVLEGASCPLREAVLINAGCAIYVADQAPTIAAGIDKARAALDEGRARELLSHIRELMA